MYAAVLWQMVACVGVGCIWLLVYIEVSVWLLLFLLLWAE